MSYYIGVDLGGTNIKAGVLDDQYGILHKASVKTNATRGADAVMADIATLVKRVAQEADISLADVPWVGVGSPGHANTDTGEILYSNNLDWHNVSLAATLEQALGQRVLIGNDANVAAFGEYSAGSGKQVSSMVAITLGTGVGGGVIIDNKILTGFNHAGGELGHMVIVKDGLPCTCGRHGCFEAYSSATGLIRLTKQRMNEHPDSKMWELTQGSLELVSGRTAFDGMRAGDAVASAVVDEYIDYLSVGILNIVNIFQPAMICMSGGICKEGDTLIVPLANKVNAEQYVKDPAMQTKIVTASLRDDAGMVGAALLGLSQ